MAPKKNGLTHRLYTGDISYDFIGHRRRWYVISAIVIAIAIGALIFRGLTFGIEFQGGSDIRVKTQVSSSTVEDFRKVVQATGFEGLDDIVVTTLGDNAVRVQTRALTPDEVEKVTTAVGEQAGLSANEVSYQLIGPSWGQQVTQQGLIALVVFLVLVMLMIWIYFREPKMSVAAIIALAHDLVLTIGIYALSGFTVTPATLIGVLTILGYSLYDTVVVFDKVRENTKDLERGKRTYSQAANSAINQVLVRSLNTTIVGVLPVAALLIAGTFVVGGGPLRDLGLALFIGMIVGAYSSVFIATPVLAQMKETEPEMKDFRARLERRRVRHHDAEEPVRGGSDEAEEASAEAEAATAGASPREVSEASAHRPQPVRKPRSQRKKG